MMNQRSFVLFSALVLLLIFSATTVLWLRNTVTLQSEFPYIVKKNYAVPVEDLIIEFVDESEQAVFTINNQERLEDLVKYFRDLSPTYSTIRLIITDEVQTFTTVWADDQVPFSYAHRIRGNIVSVYLHLDLSITEAYDWPPVRNSSQLEEMLVAALVHAYLDLDPSQAPGYTDEKQLAKESRTIDLMQRIDSDHETQLFSYSQ